MATSELPPQLHVGARCLVGGKFKATVRYLGPVDGQSGEWVGLEWDDASRGKHDGSHGGRRYFSCRFGAAASGSFVRLGKLLETVSCGCSLLDAIQRRYCAAGSCGGEDGDGGGGQAAEEADLSLRAAGGRRVAVELVGAQQVAQRLADLSSLRKASVAGTGVSSLRDGLATALPSLEELDLSDNLIAGWDFVAGLLRALPSLTALDLSRNLQLALPAWAGPPALALQPPPALATLVLNGCGVSWAQALGAAQQLPGLTELRLHGDGIASLHLLPTPPSVTASAAGGCSDGSGLEIDGGRDASHLAAALGRLRVLDLEDNQLASWGEVQLLGQLPSLQALLLSGNALPSVQYARGFTALTSLLLGRNRLSTWASVDQLDRFPALTDTRLTDNPILLSLPASSARYEVIARVGQLTQLNASAVTKMERWDAELSYLRCVTDELAAAPDEPSRQRVLAAHPRFAVLTAKYGQLAPSAPAPAAGTSLARSMVEMVLCSGGKEVTKKLPVSLTVGKLKLMIEKLLRVRVAQQALLLVPPPPHRGPSSQQLQGAAGPSALPSASAGAGVGAGAGLGGGGQGEAQPEDITDEDARELRYFNPQDGTRIEVTATDPAARSEALRRARHAAADLHQQRMEEQEKMIQQFRVVEERLMA